MSTTTTRRPPRPVFRCAQCDATTPRWVGRCPQCQAWGTVEQTGTSGTVLGVRGTAATAPTTSACPIDEVAPHAAQARTTGVDELDRVLGGGLVPGAVVLLAGEPGVGKSTLLLDVAARAARAGSTVLYVTGEESTAQVRRFVQQPPGSQKNNAPKPSPCGTSTSTIIAPTPPPPDGLQPHASTLASPT